MPEKSKYQFLTVIKKLSLKAMDNMFIRMEKILFLLIKMDIMAEYGKELKHSKI